MFMMMIVAETTLVLELGYNGVVARMNISFILSIVLLLQSSLSGTSSLSINTYFLIMGKYRELGNSVGYHLEGIYQNLLPNNQTIINIEEHSQNNITI